MKTSSLIRLPLLAVILSLGTTGCAIFQKSSTPDATKPVGGKALNIIQFRNDVQATRTAISRTTDALGRLSGAPNPQDAYASYNTELTTLSQLIDKTSRESAEVRNSGKALFTEWEKETLSIKNPDIRAVADARRLKLQTAYGEMITPLINARANFTPLLGDLTDLRKAIALDLTPAGIQAVQPLIATVNKEADTTIKSLDALAAKLDNIAAALPPPTVAPAK
ncbi:MAG TPA: DUF2959 family protein [Rariglobus sp.]|jgi:hypothetical protein|nr:DUF2959 family protein [Rariglobus sp.]